MDKWHCITNDEKVHKQVDNCISGTLSALLKKSESNFRLGNSFPIEKFCSVLRLCLHSVLESSRNIFSDLDPARVIDMQVRSRQCSALTLDLWSLIVAVLGNTNQNLVERGDPCTNLREVRAAPHRIHKRKHSQKGINNLDNVDFNLSNVNFFHQEALLFVFEDNAAMIKMISKKRSPTMRIFSEPTELRLTGYSIKSTWTPKSTSDTSKPKTKLPTC